MKGVKVTSKPLPSAGPKVPLRVPSPAKEGSLTTDAPPPAPLLTKPVELFLSENGVGGRVRGTGGESSLSTMSGEAAKKEIQWHRWKLESEIKKVVG